MNTNLKVKRILCFGDSLTNGANPKSNIRFDAKHRWTGILQDLLGSDYEILEEGLGGRTTNLDDDEIVSKNGFEYFKPCFVSLLPLFSVVLLLGTNDLKDRFNREVPEIIKSLEKYIEFINFSNKISGLEKPKVIILAPPLVIQQHVPSDWDFSKGQEKSMEFAKLYRILANETSSNFLDLSDIKPSELDGVHLDEAENQKIAEKLYQLINKI